MWCIEANPVGELHAHGYDKIDTSPFSYMRSAHFVEWLNSCQGKEKTVVPQKVLDDLCVAIHQGSPNRSCHAHTATAPEGLGHRNYYENAAQISYKLTGAPSILSRQEGAKGYVQRDSDSIREARKKIQPERRNFLSYSTSCAFYPSPSPTHHTTTSS